MENIDTESVSLSIICILLVPDSLQSALTSLDICGFGE